MKRIKHKGLNGKTAIELIPENDADREEIRRMVERDELDDRDSFGDDPEAWGFPPDAADDV